MSKQELPSVSKQELPSVSKQELLSVSKQELPSVSKQELPSVSSASTKQLLEELLLSSTTSSAGASLSCQPGFWRVLLSFSHRWPFSFQMPPSSTI